MNRRNPAGPRVFAAGQAQRLLDRARMRGKRIVFTNGVFDIIHAGHVRYLSAASRLGDLLVVGINTDASVRRLKGPRRPVNPLRERALVLASLRFVDLVVPFGDLTPLRLIKRLRPRVLVKGADWSRRDIVGGNEVESWRGRVVRIRLLRGRSTTSVIGRVLKAYSRR